MKAHQQHVMTSNTSKARLALTVLALPLALSACTSFLRQPDPVAASNLTSPDYPTLLGQNANGQPGTSIAAQGWSDFFTDPALKQLIQLGLDNNRDLRTATLNIDRTRAQYQLARSQSFPTIGAKGSVDLAGNSSDHTTTYSAGLGLTSYEIDFWGRVANLKDQALQSFFATESARSTAQISLVSQISQTYLALAADQEQLKLAKQTLVAQQQSYDLNQKQFEVGIISLVPVKQAQISVENAKLAIGNYQTLVAQDRNALALLVGQPVPETLIPTGQVYQITANQRLPAGVPSELLIRRPDIAQAEYNLKAAGANIAVARAAYFPSIGLTGNVGYSSTSLSDLFKSGAFGWNVGPSINLPIFDGGARRANLDTARVDQKLALNSYEKSIQTAFRDVADVLANRATLDDRLAAQDRLVSASKANYDLSQSRFKAGVDSYVSVLVAQTSLYNAQQGQITLKQSNLLSQVNLYTALGGGAVNNIAVVTAPNGTTTATQVTAP
jgi:NodT family efflux transporter outer membrane factor (OMF) lipoprotein